MYTLTVAGQAKKVPTLAEALVELQRKATSAGDSVSFIKGKLFFGINLQPDCEGFLGHWGPFRALGSPMERIEAANVRELEAKIRTICGEPCEEAEPS